MTEATDAERARHGDLAEDVAYLRKVCGLLVARYKGGWRINNDVVDDEGVRGRARLLRRERAAIDERVKATERRRTNAQRAVPEEPPQAAPPAIVALDRSQLADPAYRRTALAECARACVAIIESFPERERRGLLEVVGERLADAIESWSEGR